MSGELSRRETLKTGLSAAGLLALPEWLLPALAQGETDVPFTDVPATFNPRNPNGNNRFLDLRTLDGFITPADQFFFIQHYNKPEIDAAAFRLKVTGLAKKPAELSLAELKAMKPVDIVCGYECSGNSPRAMQGLSSNGRFTGVRLRDVLRRVTWTTGRGRWCSSAPIAATRKWSSARTPSRSSSSSRAASRWRTP